MRLYVWFSAEMFCRISLRMQTGDLDKNSSFENSLQQNTSPGHLRALKKPKALASG